MPLTDALILTAICVAFVGFGVLVAWGEYQTRHLSRTNRQSVEKGGQQAKQRALFIVGNAPTRETAEH